MQGGPGLFIVAELRAKQPPFEFTPCYIYLSFLPSFSGQRQTEWFRGGLGLRAAISAAPQTRAKTTKLFQSVA